MTDHITLPRFALHELLVQAAALAVVLVRQDKYKSASEVAYEILKPDALAAQQAEPVAVPEMHDAMCPALDGGRCDCSESPIGVDKAWARFCGEIGRGKDAPYPGMIEAFEAHYGQSFCDKDWRTETGIWAAAWKAAMLAAAPAPAAQAERVAMPDIEKIKKDALGNAQLLHAGKIMQAHRLFAAQGKTEKDFDCCVMEVIQAAVYQAVDLAVREARDPVWPYTAPPRPATLPTLNLSEAQIASACLSYRHDFGLLSADERTRVVFTAKEWLRAFSKEIESSPATLPTLTDEEIDVIEWSSPGFYENGTYLAQRRNARAVIAALHAKMGGAA